MAKRFMGINPAHKGYCTPMSKSTCTGARRRLALTLKKHHGFHKQLGGEVSQEAAAAPEPDEAPAKDAPLRSRKKNNLPKRSLKKKM